MTTEQIAETKRRAAIMLAACEPGAVHQYRTRGKELWIIWGDEWHDEPWDWVKYEHRIQPKPVMVPLGPEDVPPGSIFRRESWSNPHWFAVLRVSDTGVEFASQGFLVWSALRDWQISRDGGKTWQRAEKEAK